MTDLVRDFSDKERVLKFAGIGLCFLCIGLVIGMNVNHVNRFDADSAVDNVEYMMYNLDVISDITNDRVTGNSSLDYLIHTYTIKEDRSRELLKMIVTGVCLG